MLKFWPFIKVNNIYYGNNNVLFIKSGLNLTHLALAI